MKKFQLEALNYVQDTLNNTRAICKSNYIIKPIITMYENHRTKFFKLINKPNNEEVLVDLLELCVFKESH